jgi:hypothetical protein
MISGPRYDLPESKLLYDLHKKICEKVKYVDFLISIISGKRISCSDRNLYNKSKEKDEK